jgi:hypothetical protein
MVRPEAGSGDGFACLIHQDSQGKVAQGGQGGQAWCVWVQLDFACIDCQIGFWYLSLTNP